MIQHISSMARRASQTRGQTRDKSDVALRLRDWASSGSEPILVLHAGSRAQNQARAMAIKAMTAFQLETESQICWYLRTTSFSNRPPNRVDVLRSFTFQLMRYVQASGCAMDVDIAALEHLCVSSSEAEWLTGLAAVIRHQSRCFFIIETNGSKGPWQDQQGPEQGSGSLDFFERLVDLGRSSRCDVNIIIISPCDELAAAAAESIYGGVAEVQWSAPAPPHLKRLALRTRGKKQTQTTAKGRLSLN